METAYQPRLADAPLGNLIHSSADFGGRDTITLMDNDVGLDLDATADGEIRVTLTSSSWVLNIEAGRADLERLAGIADADWNERRALAVGTCGNARVYWAADPDPDAPEQATILIGQDDETWDIWIRVPQATVRELAELAVQFPRV